MAYLNYRLHPEKIFSLKSLSNNTYSKWSFSNLNGQKSPEHHILTQQWAENCKYRILKKCKNLAKCRCRTWTGQKKEDIPYSLNNVKIEVFVGTENQRAKKKLGHSTSTQQQADIECPK